MHAPHPLKTSPTKWKGLAILPFNNCLLLGEEWSFFFPFFPFLHNKFSLGFFSTTDSKHNYTTDQYSLHNALYRKLPYLRGILAFLMGLRGEGLITDFQNMPNYIFTSGINNSHFMTCHEMTTFFWRLKIWGLRNVKVQTLNKGS